jgi:hypothetical protein
MVRALRILELRAGEGSAFVRAFLVIALTIAGHTLLETARDALFLESLPPAFLTLVYVAVAIGALVVTPLSSRLTATAGARNALIVTLVVTAFGAAWFRYQTASPGLVFGLYVFGALSATTLVAEFWLLASSQFTAAQGRRLFGPLAAGGVLGAVVGAFAATLLLTRFEVRGLLTVATAAYLGAALVATFIELDDDAQPESRAAGASSTPPLSALKQDPFVRRLGGIAAVSTALSVLVDYVFKAAVWSRLGANELGPFFARYQLALNLFSLILQLFLTGKLVERLGVLGLVVLTPALLLGGGTLAALSAAGLVSVVLLKASDSVLKNSVGRVGLELLWAPVAGRERVRGFVDGVVVRAAQAVAALALLPLTFTKTTSLRTLTLVIALLALVWLSMSVRVRGPYIELFRRALRLGGLERDPSPPELDLTAVETLLEALARPDARDVLAAMNVLADRGRGRLIPALILHHKDESVLERALELFGPAERTDWLALGEGLLSHPAQAVRFAAVRALALSGAEAPLRRATQHADPALRALARLHVAQLTGEVSDVIQADASPGALAEESDRTLRLGLIEAIAAHPTPDSPATLLALAERPELRSAVTLALSRMDDSTSISFLIGRLSSRDDRMAARKGLVRRGAHALGFREPGRGRGAARGAARRQRRPAPLQGAARAGTARAAHLAAHRSRPGDRRARPELPGIPAIVHAGRAAPGRPHDARADEPLARARVDRRQDPAVARSHPAPGSGRAAQRRHPRRVRRAARAGSPRASTRDRVPRRARAKLGALVRAGAEAVAARRRRAVDGGARARRRGLRRQRLEHHAGARAHGRGLGPGGRRDRASRPAHGRAQPPAVRAAHSP